MWQKIYSITVKGIEPSQVWKIWSDIKSRPLWDDDMEWADIQGDFVQDAIFFMKPKGGAKLKMKITQCSTNKSFTDTYQFPLARMDGIHEMEQTNEGLRITTTIQIQGPLAWLWRKLVAEKVADTLPHQTGCLIELARSK